MNTRLSVLALGAVAALGTLPLVACETNRQSAIATSDANIEVTSSANRIVVGETVTLVARTTDTYGRDAEVKWNTTAGDLKTEQNGRIARVTFDEIGTYTVRASLDVDGRTVSQDIQEVRVVALR